MRLDWVSPLPPVRSGISDYSADLLPFLAERCDLRVIGLPEQPVSDEMAARWQPVPADRLAEDARVPVYQMGNNHHHALVWRLALETPGILVLHDVVLHHFLIERTVKEKDFEGYRAQLAADHGWVGDAASLPFRWPGGAGSSAQFALPAHRSLLAAQRGVLVHSRWARGVLEEEIPGLRVAVVPMGIPLPEAVDDRSVDDRPGAEFRRRHGIPLEVPVLGSFGFQTPMKRTEEVIRALGEPELADVHLVVAGEVAPILELDRVAAESGAGDRVHALGFLDWRDFESAIAACDLALNLRYPTAGETSASLLRILALGRPVVVSDHAQMADLPDDVVVKIPVGDDERRALAERLSELLADRDRLAAFGRSAREHVARHHRLEDAADAVVAAVAEWGGLEPPQLPATPPPPPTSLAWHDMAGRLEVAGADAPWRAGERRTLRISLYNDSAAVWLAAERPAGGVALQLRLVAGGENLLRDQGWHGLPHDVAPGGRYDFELPLRRPLADDVRLDVLPHVLGFTGLPDLGGPAWSRRI